jgi:hypothetical protein
MRPGNGLRWCSATTRQGGRPATAARSVVSCAARCAEQSAGPGFEQGRFSDPAPQRWVRERQDDRGNQGDRLVDEQQQREQAARPIQISAPSGAPVPRLVRRSMTGPASRPSANRMREAPTAQASEAPNALTITTPPRLIRFPIQPVTNLSVTVTSGTAAAESWLTPGGDGLPSSSRRCSTGRRSGRPRTGPRGADPWGRPAGGGRDLSRTGGGPDGTEDRASEFCQSNAVVVPGRDGVLLVDPGVLGFRQPR